MIPMEIKELKTEKFLNKKNPEVSNKNKALFIIKMIRGTIFETDATFNEMLNGLILSIKDNTYPSFLNSIFNAFNDIEWYVNRKIIIEKKNELDKLPICERCKKKVEKTSKCSNCI